MPFQNNSYIYVISAAKLKKIIIFAFTYVSESLVLLYGDFGMNAYSIDSGEAIRGGEVLKLHHFNFSEALTNNFLLTPI